MKRTQTTTTITPQMFYYLAWMEKKSSLSFFDPSTPIATIKPTIANKSTIGAVTSHLPTPLLPIHLQTVVMTKMKV
jgi:hypothetical protein